MMVTKQQQLEWLAKVWINWNHSSDHVYMSKSFACDFVSMTNDSHRITRQEWQHERDKMQKQSAQVSQSAQPTQPAPDNSWHERGELPPVGCECEMINDRGEWVKCDVIAHKDSFCVAWVRSRMSPFYTNDWNEFRPCRTEREKAIDEMKAMCAYPGSWDSTYKAFAEALYDDNYRKVKS